MAFICFDPGHGGSDPGACNAYAGLRECDVALDICLMAKVLAEAQGHSVILTRDTDRDVSYPNSSASEELGARCYVANDAGVDIFVSVHINAAENPAAEGTETFHCQGDAKGALLAACVQAAMLVSLGRLDRGVKEAGHYVTRNTKAPACLAEVAFISNADETALMLTQEFRYKAADAVVSGINSYLQQT